MNKRATLPKASNSLSGGKCPLGMVLTVNSWGINPELCPQNPLPMLQRFPDDSPPLHTPRPFHIASLAAQPRFANLPSKAAAEAALDLYFDCRAAVLNRREKYKIFAKGSIVLNSFRRPARWPGTLDDFLRLIVRAKDRTTGLPRFKEYLLECVRQDRERLKLPKLSQLAEITAVEKVVKKLKAAPEAAFSAQYWPWIAFAYAAWWKHQCYAAKRRGGLARAAKAYKNKSGS